MLGDVHGSGALDGVAELCGQCRLCEEEGLFCGLSSGANVLAEGTLLPGLPGQAEHWSAMDLSRLTEQPTRAALLVYLAVEGEVNRDGAQAILWGRRLRVREG